MLLFNLTEFHLLIGWQAKEMECTLCLNSIFYRAIWRTATFKWWIGGAKYSNKYPKGWIWKIIYHLSIGCVSREHLTFLSNTRGRKAVLQRLFRTLNIKRKHEWETSFTCIKKKKCVLEPGGHCNLCKQTQVGKQQSGTKWSNGYITHLRRGHLIHTFVWRKDRNLKVVYHWLCFSSERLATGVMSVILRCSGLVRSCRGLLVATEKKQPLHTMKSAPCWVPSSPQATHTTTRRVAVWPSASSVQKTRFNLNFWELSWWCRPKRLVTLHTPRLRGTISQRRALRAPARLSNVYFD